VGRTHLSNTGNDAFVTPPWYAVDATASLRVRSATLRLQGNNLADRRIFTGGYTDGTESYYYVMAGRSLFATLELGF
jgi:hypothetical protein